MGGHDSLSIGDIMRISCMECSREDDQYTYIEVVDGHFTDLQTIIRKQIDYTSRDLDAIFEEGEVEQNSFVQELEIEVQNARNALDRAQRVV
ncbi:hypothetical protein N7456_006760 [Penicillium angulare]|uniref:Uncharacterized protein n=1 Tax=Penicillium angulare TaxID=116970 RepID=A0A9W9KC96_9EURO|nr:hypothetical protein N7456_006760 [Penicillium angulare]